MIKRRINTELVIGAAIPEMQTRRDREVGLERDGQLVEYTIACWRSMCEEDSSFRRIVDTVGCVNESTDLQ